MPGVSLDDQLLAMLSIGVPVGLGIYLAWVPATAARTPGLRGGDRRRPRRRLAGFHASTGLLALLTAILGATVGANLALIVLDVWRARAAAAAHTKFDARGASLEPTAGTP